MTHLQQSPSRTSNTPSIQDVPAEKDATAESSVSPRAKAAVNASAIVALSLCFVGSQIANFLSGPGLNYIAAGLNIGSQRSWISTSSGLATACIVPVSGYIQDLVGRKGTLFASLVVLLVGLILSATAQSFAQLIAGSVLWGMGSGIEELTCLAALAELVPANRRGLIFSFAISITLLFGPSLLYASELSIHVSWRWIFWVPFIWNAVAAIFAAATYGRMKLVFNEPKEPLTSWKRLDFLGMALLVAGGAEILIALQSGGSSRPWRSAYVIVQLCLGVVLLGLFVFWESRDIGRPLVPFRLFKGQRVVAITFVISMLSGFFYTTALSLGTTMLNEVFQRSTLQTALLSLGSAFGLTIGATAVNMLLTVLDGRARELLLVSATTMLAFSGAQACIAPGRGITWAVVASFASLGIGGTEVPLSTIATIACPQDLIGTAVGLIIAIRTLGGSLGYAIFYSVYTGYANAHIPNLVRDSAMENGLSTAAASSLATVFAKSNNPSDPHLGSQITNNATILEAAHLAYATGAARAAQLVFFGLIPVGVVVVICAMLLPNLRDFLDDRVVTRQSTAEEQGETSS